MACLDMSGAEEVVFVFGDLHDGKLGGGGPLGKSTALEVRRPMLASHLLVLCKSGQVSSCLEPVTDSPWHLEQSATLRILTVAYKIICDLTLPLSPGSFPITSELDTLHFSVFNLQLLPRKPLLFEHLVNKQQ